MIIFFSKSFFLNFFNSSKVYIRHSLNNKKKYNSIREDMFSAADYRYCDHLALCIEKKITDIFFQSKKTAFLSNWGGDIYRKYFIGTGVTTHTRLIFEYFMYAKKIYKEKNLTGEIYIYPVKFSYKIYSEMATLGEIPNNIKIHPIAILVAKIHESLKSILFLFLLFVYPFSLLFKCQGKKPSQNQFTSCVYLDDGLLERPFSSNDKLFRLFDKSKTLFIDTREWSSSAWVSNVGLDINSLILEQSVFSISRVGFVKRYFDGIFLLHVKFLWLSLNAPLLARGCYTAARSYMLWNIFYEVYSIKNMVNIMVKPDITSSVVHQKKNTKTIFLAYSVAEGMVKNLRQNNIGTCIDYTYIIANEMISSRITNNWFKTLDNKINQYVDIGPIFSDLVFFAKKNKKNILEAAEINNKQIITFLDQSVGHRGVFNICEYREFLNCIVTLSEIYKDVLFLYKSKKELSFMAQTLDRETLEVINVLNSRDNYLYANGLGLSSYESIGISDIVVTVPTSSTVYESLGGGVKTILFDPKGVYSDYNYTSNSFSNFNSNNINELIDTINYWLIECQYRCFKGFVNREVTSYISISSYGNQNIEKVKKHLN